MRKCAPKYKMMVEVLLCAYFAESGSILQFFF